MISIVTAFFDIGRSTWEGSNLPEYLKRTTEYYFQNFERLLKLENQIIVFTSSDLVPKFDEYKKQKGNLKVIGLDGFPFFNNIANRVKEIQASPEFQITLKQPWNPEYWSSDYVMVNFLKSYFVGCAVDFDLVESDMVAWIDFAYCRKDEDIPITKWDYEFVPTKIHFFTTRENVPERIDIRNIIDHNEVYIMGCHIVASKKNWGILERSIWDSMEMLLKNELCDDDQLLLHMAFIKEKSLYMIHRIDENHSSGWFQMFTTFNKEM